MHTSPVPPVQGNTQLQVTSLSQILILVLCIWNWNLIIHIVLLILVAFCKSLENFPPPLFAATWDYEPKKRLQWIVASFSLEGNSCWSVPCLKPMGGKISASS